MGWIQHFGRPLNVKNISSKTHPPVSNCFFIFQNTKLINTSIHSSRCGKLSYTIFSKAIALSLEMTRQKQKHAGTQSSNAVLYKNQNKFIVKHRSYTLSLKFTFLHGIKSFFLNIFNNDIIMKKWTRISIKCKYIQTINKIVNISYM